MSTPSQYLGDLGSAAGIYSGLQRGTPLGYLRSAANAMRLSGGLTGGSGLSSAGNDLGSILGLYQGLQTGGIPGYGEAAASGLKLAGALSDNPALSTVGGYIAAPLAVYNAINNWHSGETGSDALQGAEAGAAVGSAIFPGIGTLVGGLIGGAGGALSSAFGPGAPDPEGADLRSYLQAATKNPSSVQGTISPEENFRVLAGLFDARSSDQPIYQQYGRMGETGFLNAMDQEINQAYKSGAIKPGESAANVYSGVLNPWIENMSNPYGSGGKGWDVKGTTGNVGGEYNPAVENLVTNLAGEYMSGQLNPTTQLTDTGSRDTTMPWYAGISPQEERAIEGQSRLQDVINAGGRTDPEIRQRLRARGGHMPKTSSKNLSRLRELYKGSFAARRRFDDGGGVGYQMYSQYTTPAYDQFSASQLRDTGAGLTGNSIASQYTPSAPAPIAPLDPSQLSNPYGSTPITGTPNDVGDYLNSQNIGSLIPSLPAGGGSPGGGGGGSGSSTASNLSGLLQSLGLSSGIAGGISSALPLLPLLNALVNRNSGQAQPPAQPSGIPSGNIAPIATPQVTRQYTNPQMSQQDWYTYGQRPEMSFFSNNQLPTIAGVSPPGVARGGHLPTPPGPQLPEQQGDGYVGDPGMGDGTSDDVPARLSGGEWVADAGTVSMLGNGSNEAGARRLEQMRQNIRKDAGKKLVKGKQFMKAKPPQAYMGKSKGGSVDKREVRRIAHSVVGEHVDHRAPEGHRGLGRMIERR